MNIKHAKSSKVKILLVVLLLCDVCDALSSRMSMVLVWLFLHQHHRVYREFYSVNAYISISKLLVH